MSVKRSYEEDTYRNDRAHLYPAERERFNLSFPFFRKPVEIGSFSTDIQGRFSDTRHALKFYIKPRDPCKVNFDLRKGYSSMIRKDENAKTYINSILRWILLHPQRFAINDEKQTDEPGIKKRNLHTDFICWRGLLTKLLCTPYENREDWQVAVILYNGTYYMCEFDTEGKKKEKESRTAAQDEMCCWGWKFEQYLTADSADGKPDTDSQYNNIENFATIVRSRLNKHSIVFSGEVDAVQTNHQGKKSYVEFKSTREITHPRQLVSFKRYKLIKWWAQSYLVGISEIVCGYRDDDGIINRLETMDVHDIPDRAKDIRDPWRPNVCFNFLDHLLCFIKDNITIDSHRVVHLLEWRPGNNITCTKLTEDSEFCFLPDWYINPI